MSAASKSNSNLPTLHRKGVSWDPRAKQFTCRVGYKLNNQAERVRDFQYLGRDPDEATIKHINLERAWADTKDRWRTIARELRMILPYHLEYANISKPFWIDPDWEARAKIRTHEGLVGALEGIKEHLKSDQSQLPDLPPDLRGRVLAAIAPTVHEARGTSVEAQRLTIGEAADAYLEYKRQKIGLVIPGLKKGGGLKPQTYNGVEVELTYALKHLDTRLDLNALTHERLEEFRDDCYRAAASPRTAFNHAKAVKSMLDWAHRNNKIDYRTPDAIDDIFALARPETTKKLTYDASTIAKLKAIKQSAEDIKKRKGAEIWMFALLALNAGAYQVDIGTWTFENLKMTDDGKPYLWWQRQKSSHQNTTLFSRHDLWPETWALMKKNLAPKSARKNPTRRLFLTKKGQEMYRTALGAPRVDGIGLRYRRAALKAIAGQDEKGNDVVGVDLPFMQLRKVALNAIKKASGGSDDVTRKFAGQKVPGVLRAYLNDEFDDVSVALVKWRERLIADGVL